jgi:hypothetical protein
MDDENIIEGCKLLILKYSHIKKLVVFMMYTVRKVRNLAKLKDKFES